MTVITPYALLVINIIDHYKIKWKQKINDFRMEEQYSSIEKGNIRRLDIIEKKEYEKLSIRFNYDVSTYTEMGKNLMLLDYLMGRVQMPESLIEKVMEDIIRFDLLSDDTLIVDVKTFTEKMLKNVISKFAVNTKLLSLLKQILIRKLRLSYDSTLNDTVKEALNGRRSLIVRAMLNDIIVDIVKGYRRHDDDELKCIAQDIKTVILAIRPFDYVFIEITEESNRVNDNLFYVFIDIFSLDEFLQFYLNCMCYYGDSEQYDLFIENLKYVISKEGEYYTDNELERIYIRFLSRFFNNKLYTVKQNFIQRLFPLFIESTEVLRHLAVITKCLCVKYTKFSDIPIRIHKYEPVLAKEFISQLRNMEIFYGIIQEKYDYPQSLLNEEELSIYNNYFTNLTDDRLWQLLLFKHSYKSGQFLKEESIQFYKVFCGISFGQENESVETDFESYRFLNCSAESIILLVARK